MENRASIGWDGKRRARLVVGLLGLLLSVGYGYMASRLPMGRVDQPGPGIFPLVLAGVMAVASLLLVAEQVRERRATESGALELPRGAELRRVLGLAVSIVLYIIVAMWVGNLPGSFLLCLGIVRLLDTRPWRRVAVTAAAVALGVHVLFVVILGVPLPEGSLLK